MAISCKIKHISFVCCGKEKNGLKVYSIVEMDKIFFLIIFCRLFWFLMSSFLSIFLCWFFLCPSLRGLDLHTFCIFIFLAIFLFCFFFNYFFGCILLFLPVPCLCGFWISISTYFFLSFQSHIINGNFHKNKSNLTIFKFKYI